MQGARGPEGGESPFRAARIVLPKKDPLAHVARALRAAILLWGLGPAWNLLGFAAAWWFHARPASILLYAASRGVTVLGLVGLVAVAELLRVDATRTAGTALRDEAVAKARAARNLFALTAVLSTLAVGMHYSSRSVPYSVAASAAWFFEAIVFVLAWTRLAMAVEGFGGGDPVVRVFAKGSLASLAYAFLFLPIFETGAAVVVGMARSSYPWTLFFCFAAAQACTPLVLLFWTGRLFGRVLLMRAPRTP